MFLLKTQQYLTTKRKVKKLKLAIRAKETINARRVYIQVRQPTPTPKITLFCTVYSIN